MGLADYHVPEFPLRLECDPTGDFEDRPSQTVWYRDQPVPEFSVTESDTQIEIGLTEFGTTWHYGDDSVNLGRTTRTLDAVDGQTDLRDGLLARDGWSVLDDSDSVVFEDGWVTCEEVGTGHDPTQEE